ATGSIPSGMGTAEIGSAHDRADRMGVASESPLESDRGATREENAGSGSRHPLRIRRVLEGLRSNSFLGWHLCAAILARSSDYSSRARPTSFRAHHIQFRQARA